MLPKPRTIDEYISRCPVEFQLLLEKIRKTIIKQAPKAEEAIRYGMPTFLFHGTLVHFAAFKNHIGFYPAPIGIKIFEKEIFEYKSGEGSLQFPLDKPIPFDLIKKMVKYYTSRNLQKISNK